LRFQSASSQYLVRTPASAGNRQKFTFSFWAKRGTLSAGQEMYFVNSGGGNFAQISWNSSNQIDITSADSSVAICQLVTTPVYRDPSAWYHIVFSIDTTQATASNRVKIYVNGSQVTALSTATYPSLNYNFQLNNTTAQNIGRPSTGTFDGYLAEYNFIDGQQYDPSYFGQTDTTTGQWVAKKYTGTYGTNGFYLPFSNGTSTTTLGADSSGNSNNWTLNNFTRSAGVSDCWMFDVPSGNGGVSGTQPSSNYCIANPLDKGTSFVTVTNSNLLSTTTSGGAPSVRGSLGVTSGKWYWEITPTSMSRASIGILNSVADVSLEVGGTVNGWGYLNDGRKYNSADSAYGASYTNNDVVGVALDMDAGTITFYKNGVSQGQAFSGITGTIFPACSRYGGTGTDTLAWNFGQRSFAYTPPTGFKALCTANLPEATIKKGNQFMDATTYTGTGATATITNAGGFSPDLLWIKQRSTGTTQNNTVWDTNRGIAGGFLVTNSTDATGFDGGGVTSFNSNGWTMGSSAGLNESGKTFVAWQWQAGGSTVTNTSGTISSQVRANPTDGVSVVTYTTPSSGSNMTVGHGLGVAPSMIIVKPRASGAWINYHRSNGNTSR
jgi:hypothetical protein